MNTTIVAVNKDNLSEHPQSICFINPKHEQFEHGLKIKLLYIEGQKKPVGFVEYLPGEQCRRAVDAEGSMFIHCLWTNGKKFQHQGLGSQLIYNGKLLADRYISTTRFQNIVKKELV